MVYSVPIGSNALSLEMIFIGLGSNEGEPANNILQSLAILAEKGVSVVRCSSLYRTEPWGIREQNAFVNAVAEVGFPGSASELLTILLSVEQEMGRVRRFKWGPRLIDLDILEFNGEVIDQDRLKVPHPFYPERDFVLVPLAELEPEWQPTGSDLLIRDLIAALEPIRMERLSGS